MSSTRFFLYARKSTEGEEKQALSIESQVTEMHHLAKRFEVEIVREFHEARSAKEPGRPVFNEMIEALKRGEADGIITWKLDRLARNALDQGTVQYLLQKAVIKRIITSEKTFLPEDNVLLMNVELGMANQYIMDLRRNVMRGNKTKLEKGWLPGRPPIGYLNHKESKTIHIDPERFSKVQALFSKFLTGNYTPRQLLDVARDELHLTAVVKPKSPIKKMDRSYIYKILRDPFYAGVIVRAGQTYQGSHERMISLFEHQRILALLNKQKKSQSAVKTKPKELFILSGMIKCLCGRMVTAYQVKKSSGKRYSYYACSRKSCHTDGVKCAEPIVTASIVEAKAMDIVSRIALPVPLADWIKAWAKHGHMYESFLGQLELEGLNREQERLAKRLRSLTTNLLDEVIERDVYQLEKSKTSSELSAVETRLALNMERLKEWERAACDAMDLSKVISTIYSDTDDHDIKRLILKAVGLTFVLKNKELDITIKRPFKVISNNKIVLTPEDEQSLTQEIRLLETKNSTFVKSSLSWCTPDDSNVWPLPSEGSALSS